MSAPSIRSSSASVFDRCVPVAMKMVMSDRGMSGISSNSACSCSRRGWARVMSQTEIATRLPGRTCWRSGAQPIGAPIARASAAGTSATAGRGIGSMTVMRSSGRSTSRPSVP